MDRPEKNKNNKLVGTISEDQKVFTHIEKGFKTVITANPDGTLNIQHFDKDIAA